MLNPYFDKQQNFYYSDSLRCSATRSSDLIIKFSKLTTDEHR